MGFIYTKKKHEAYCTGHQQDVIQDVTRTLPKRLNCIMLKVLDAAQKIKLLATEDDEHAIILKEDNFLKKF